MANEPKTDPSKTHVQTIPLTKIHDLPGVPVMNQPDKSYGGLVSSIQTSGVKEPVILRQREDGEYQLLHGARRRRASELAKQKDIPALVYEMTVKEAVDFARKRRNDPDLPIPGKLQTTPAQEDKAAPVEDAKETDGKDKAAPTAGDEAKAAPKDKPEGKEKPAEDAPKDKLEGKGKPAEPAAKEGEKPSAEDKAKEGKKETAPAEKAAAPAAPAGPAATGPSGTAIRQVFDPRLDPPSEKDLTTLPAPQGEEAYFITLHPGYLEKSKYNEFSVDRESENFKELFKAIELAGVKDPVLARPKEGGGLEILSGQRRHLVATELNYPVPTIVQNIDDDDAKIIVADCNLHRDKITSFDLSRALRMKMDGMKRKAGRRKKSDPTAPLLNSDEALAKEMGMSVSKLNTVSYPYAEKVGIVSNEEALMLNLPFNRSIEGGYGGIFGTFFICGLEDDHFCSLTDEQVERYKKKFHKAEILIGVRGNEPITMKVDPKPKERPDPPQRPTKTPER